MTEEEDKVKEQEALEGRAKLQGWVPKEEFQGDAEMWKPADEFLKHGEQIQPILKERLKDLESKLTDATAESKKQREAIEKFAEYHKKTEDRAYKKALRDVKALQLEAVEAGDKEKFLELDKEIEGLETPAEKKIEKKTEPIVPAEFVEWQKDHKWYGTDIEMSAYADTISPFIDRSLKGKPFFDEIEKEVKKKFPEKFGNIKRDDPAAVEGAGSGGGGTSKKTYSDLPADAKKACDDFVKDGLLTKEQYLKDFDWD